jgi:VWFA-related protein
MVRADIRPPERSADVARVTFFVDGVELCTDSSPPFECATRSRDLRGLLERMAAVSGGQALFADHRVGLSAAFSAIVEDLSHQYLIGYQPASQKRDGAWRKIRIEVDGPYRLRHRQGYRLLPEGRS